MKNAIGIVLGGGKGTRLFPLTYVRSKPAVPLGGKYRLIDIPISNCINSEINKIYVLTQYNSASLNRHVNLTYRFGLFNDGFVDILAAEQTHENVHWYQGTADAVRQSLRHVLAERVDHILILSGDQLYRMDFGELWARHLERDADVSICVIPVEEERARGFGILKMENTGRITSFREKPQKQEQLDQLKVDPDVWQAAGVTPERPLMASMGIYLFKAEVLLEVLRDEAKMDFGGHVIPAALDDFRVFGHIFTGYWEDIGTIRAFYKANMDLTDPRPQFSFYDVKAPIYTHPRFLPASRILDCEIQGSIISDGCELSQSRVSGSVIGIRSRIGRQTVIEDSLIMGADFYDLDQTEKVPMGVGDGSHIRRAILDKNARIGRDVEISNQKGVEEADGSNYYIRDGIVIIPKNAVLEDGTVI